jgi:hypothetical protein
MSKNGKSKNLPSMPVHLIPPSWPLQRWGMDPVGPLLATQGNCRFATVAVDYFTKWVEAKPLANINAPTIQKLFLAKHNLQIWSSKRTNCY